MKKLELTKDEVETILNWWDWVRSVGDEPEEYEDVLARKLQTFIEENP